MRPFVGQRDGRRLRSAPRHRRGEAAGRQRATRAVTPRHLNRLTATALVGAIAVTVAVVAGSRLPYAVSNPALHAAVETGNAAIGILAATLAAGRFRRNRLASDLALALAFLVFGAVNLLFSVAPLVLGHGYAVGTWAAVAGRLLGTMLFCLAAFVPARAVRAPTGARLTAAAVGLLGMIGVTVAMTAGSLPVGVGLVAGASPDALPTLVAHPVVTGGQAAAFGLYAAAAVGFWRRARSGDELSAWLSTAAILGAFARVHFMFFPSLYADVVYSGDVLRVGFYAVVLAGVGREVAKYWRELADAAVLEERRRMARELHDGLAQELAFVASEAEVLTRQNGAEDRARMIRSAAVRALDESRRAIAALTRPIDEPLAVAVTQTAEEVAHRLGARVHVDADPGLEVGTLVREALLRIVREAVTNAVRHGRAPQVTVRLSITAGLPPTHVRSSARLEVADDGEGFAPAAVGEGQGFGLTSMRERAESLEGTFRVVSSPGAGTRVEVVVPT